jgi:Rrf2 family protein
MTGGEFFSQRFGYAAHALAYMAKKPEGALTTLPELAAWMRSIWPEASEAYLSNVVQRLARGGVLRSHRGIAGGYSLARPPKQITLRAVREILDGVPLARCMLSLGPECPVRDSCAIRDTLCAIEDQYMKSLEKVNIAGVAAQMDIAIPADALA